MSVKRIDSSMTAAAVRVRPRGVTRSLEARTRLEGWMERRKGGRMDG